MDSTHTRNENSSDEKDTKETANNENSSTTRSYDCAFCKRGFTNAQALGGHMNIHRKDKAKAKKISEPSVSHKAGEYFAPITNDQAQFYASLRANNNYQMFGSSPNLNYPHTFTPQGASSPDISTPYKEFMDSNLSLTIGLPNIMEENRKELKRESNHGDTICVENDHVDLELRLGQNP